MQYIKIIVYVLLWIGILSLLGKISVVFAFIFIVVSIIYGILSNLDDGKSEGLSAYSVFNKNMERLPGTLTTDNFMLPHHLSWNSNQSKNTSNLKQRKTNYILKKLSNHKKNDLDNDSFSFND